MIRVNELRFGNLVSDTHASDTFSAKVNKITDSRVYYGSFHSHPNDLKPISLTEEWLIKFGFKKTWFGYENISTGIEIEPLKKGDYTICINANEYHVGESFKYVHQLQNIYFALTNKELELIKE